jgi:molybdopterin molybdotransferase
VSEARAESVTTDPQRLPASLTSLEAALEMLCNGLKALVPQQVQLSQALGCVAAEMPPIEGCPPFDLAAADGWAFPALDLVGASSYAPLLPTVSPRWVEVGDVMPQGCDCVVDIDAVDASGPIVQVLAEGFPGQGVRRAGSDIAAGSVPVAGGHPIRSLDLLRARAAGQKSLMVRRPRLHLVNMAVTPDDDLTALLIAGLAQAAGAAVTQSRATFPGSDVGDLLVCIGGTGVGRRDATVRTLARSGVRLAHGIALRPGRTSAVGMMGTIPVVALPGAPDQALAAWWTLALPVLDRLAGRLPRSATTLVLARKIASAVGVMEIALLRQTGAKWLPLAVGELSLDAIAGADAWCAIPAESEGFAAGALVDAYMLKA